MGNCNCSMKAVTDSRKSSDFNFARIMTDSGEILNLKGPKLVRQVLNEFPGYNIFSSNCLSSPLHNQELLLDGQFYYLHPVIEKETEHILEEEEEEKTEQIRVSSSLTKGSAMEVLPAQREGVWRVKLIINPQQLEEIFSEEGNTEALIEQMRIAANTSTIAKHTRSTSCGVNWKSTLPSVFKLPNEKQNKILALDQSSTSSPR